MGKQLFFIAAAALAALWACGTGSAGASDASRATTAMRAVSSAGSENAVDARGFPNPPPEPAAKPQGTRIAVLAGGCFWGMEGVFEKLTGVIDVISGYSGGDAATANYETVGTGTTGHAESIKVLYDPAKISYGTLLKVYFSVAHDPTELGYQGPDRGTQYRSAIFYGNEEQKRMAEAYIDILNKAHAFDGSVVTEAVPLKAFYPAEAYHQNFMDNNPDYPYIVMWDAPKVKKLLSAYPELVTNR